jgi:lipoate-protein ligase A
MAQIWSKGEICLEKWRFIDLDLVALPFLHSIEEAIAKEKLQNTLLLWRVNKPCITLGYFQNVYQEVDVSACEKLGIPIIRRMGGGGTGYLTPNVLAYSTIASENSEAIPKNTEKSYEVICNGVTLGLKELTLDATFAPINDVLLNGKKFSGSSQHRSYGMVIQHGFLSIDLNLQDLAKVIRVPMEKLQDKGASSLEERITWINKELKRAGREDIGLDLVKEALRSGFEKALKVSFSDGRLTDKELKAAEEFRKTFESETWNIKPRLFRRVNAQSVYKAKKGVIRVNAHIINGKISEILMTGDYIMHPVEAITDLEAMLRGVKAEEQHVRKTVNEFYKRKKITTLGASPEDFTLAIIKAIKALT